MPIRVVPAVFPRGCQVAHDLFPSSRNTHILFTSWLGTEVVPP